MRLDAGGRPLHLTYCTNIHPGERLAELRATIEGPVRAVKARVSPDRPMGLGLWIPAAALSLLQKPEEREDFRALLTASGLYLFTVNGFPYGRFHGTRVKESVYQPDWRRAVRAAHTRSLAELLAALLPPDLSFGSISTVPGTTRALARDAGAVEAIVDHLLEVAAHLHALREEGGRTVVLALEPEPGCLLESTEDVLRFFEDRLFAADTRIRFGRRLGVGAGEAEEILRRHLGLCFDVAHFAVGFEEPARALERLAQAGITIAKLQLSCALRIASLEEQGRKAARRFDDGVYLHQTAVRTEEGTIRRFLDLPAALQAEIPGEREWRIHVHVPIFTDSLEPPLATTRGELEAAVRAARRLDPMPHFEVETYSFDVLPAELRDLAVEEAIARELLFARGLLEG